MPKRSTGREPMREVSLSEWWKLLEVAMRGRVEGLLVDGDRPATWKEVGNQNRWQPTQVSVRITGASLRRWGRQAEDTVRGVQEFLDVHDRGSAVPIDLITFSELLRDSVELTQVRVPASFAAGLMQGGRADTYEKLLVRVGGLVAARRTAVSVDDATATYARLNGGEAGTGGPVDVTIRQMVDLVTVPSRWNQLLLREIGALHEWAVPIAAEVARTSPAGWRATRALGIVLRHLRVVPHISPDSVAREVDIILGVLKELVEAPNRIDLDPARGFLEEALRQAPGPMKAGRVTGWHSSWAFAPAYLEDRARDPDAPPRQRAFAALCLAERASSAPIATDVAQAMRDERDERLARIAAFLDQKVAETEGGSRESISDDMSADLRVRISSAVLEDVPEKIREPIAGFARRSVLFYDVTKRRIACDALLASGQREPATRVIGALLEDPNLPFTVRDNACVALGYMGDPTSVPGLLVAARSDSEVRHAAVMAIGSLESDPTGEGIEVVEAAVGDADARIAAAAVYATAVRALWDQDRPARLGTTDRVASSVAGGPQAVRAVAAWGQRLVIHGGRLPFSGASERPVG